MYFIHMWTYKQYSQKHRGICRLAGIYWKKLSCEYFSLTHVYFRYIIFCSITISNIGWNFRYLSKEKCSFFTKILIEKPSSFSFSPRSLHLFWHAISEIFTFIFTNEHRNIHRMFATILLRVDISCLLSQFLF